MSEDIVERLRSYEYAYEPPLKAFDHMDEAADEIERLRGLFVLDGEQHALIVKGLTEAHEKRISKYFDEIERLRAENGRLREALEPFGLVASIFENDDADRTVSLGRWYPSPILPEPGDFGADIKYTVADFRRAALALSKENK
jgi:hypothetical protein